MLPRNELKFPVLDGVLTEFLKAGAEIRFQDGSWHLFRADGESLAQGKKISLMLESSIWRHG